MRLILLSKYFIESAQVALQEFTGKDNADIKLAFCSNAGDIFAQADRGYIDLARKELLAAKYQLIDLDLKNSLDEILSILDQVDATFFTGGSFNHLMHLFNKSGLTEKYPELLKKGLIHIGFSAGAMICSNDFQAYNVFAEYIVEDIDKGLGLFPYYIIPHYSDKPKYTKAFADVIKAGYKQVIPLTNMQGITVQENNWQLLDE